jgi:glycosyltransferase involved in cell wall biosynthesis
MNTCDVSVIIPTRFRPALVCRAIHSALRQTVASLEVIVVLDGIDPATAKAVTAIPDTRVRLISLVPSKGGSEARNAGVRAARGRYIALLDDDDEWLPDKLEKQLALADSAATSCFAVVTQYLYRVPGHADEVWPGHIPAAHEPLSEFLFSSRGGFQTSTYLCPRTLFLDIPFTPGLKKHQDWDWFLRLANKPGFQLLIVPEPLSVYHVPLRSRAGVSVNLDWKFSRAWAQSCLPLMTTRAYASFLVKICARSAAIQSDALISFFPLLHELLFIARPSPRLVAEFAAAFLLPESLRLRLRYALAPSCSASERTPQCQS